VLPTNQKGAIAEMKIATAAVELGVPVLRPMQEHGRYAMAFEIGARLLRVQCKWARLSDDRATISVRLQTQRRSATGFVRWPFLADEIDAVSAYCGALDRC
jgi:hypothetical protein